MYVQHTQSNHPFERGRLTEVHRDVRAWQGRDANGRTSRAWRHFAAGTEYVLKWRGLSLSLPLLSYYMNGILLHTTSSY